jgi:hypothetical protein
MPTPTSRIPYTTAPPDHPSPAYRSAAGLPVGAEGLSCPFPMRGAPTILEARAIERRPIARLLIRIVTAIAGVLDDR